MSGGVLVIVIVGGVVSAGTTSTATATGPTTGASSICPANDLLPIVVHTTPTDIDPSPCAFTPPATSNQVIPFLIPSDPDATIHPLPKLIGTGGHALNGCPLNENAGEAKVCASDLNFNVCDGPPICKLNVTLNNSPTFGVGLLTCAFVLVGSQNMFVFASLSTIRGSGIPQIVGVSAASKILSVKLK